MNISVIGSGYAALVDRICFSHLSHNGVRCDRDEVKIDRLRQEELPIYKPRFETIFNRCAQMGLFAFSRVERVSAG